MHSASNNPSPIHVLGKFRIIFGTMRQHFREIESHCGISGSQLWLLQEIQHTPGIGISALAERLSIHQSTCSLLVEKIVTAGLAKKIRSQADQRRVGLSITPQGTSTLSKAPGPAEGVLPDALAQLPAATLRNLDRALTELVRRLDTADTTHSGKPLADM